MEFSDEQLQKAAESYLKKQGLNILFEVCADNRSLKVTPKFQYREAMPSFFNEIANFNDGYISENEISVFVNYVISEEPNNNLVDNQVYILQKAIDELFTSKTWFFSINDFFKDDFPFYVDSVSIADFFSISKMEFRKLSQSNEIYFLGENGDGKSLILMGIYLAFNGRYVIQNTEAASTGEVKDLLKAVPKSKFSATDTQGNIYSDDSLASLNNFFAYGVHRGRYNTDEAEKYGFMTLFADNRLLRNPETWLIREYARELQAELNRRNGVKDDKLQRLISANVLIELFEKLLEGNVRIHVDVDRVRFKEKGYDLTFDQLSEGYRNLMIWVSDLLFRLLENQPRATALNELHGVVMVDEIELHLHPKWQRTLVPKLRKIFPNIQFVFTTHSPTIIQAAADEAIIYRVFRNPQTGHTEISEPWLKKDINDLMLNSLVTSPLFGLEDARLSDEAMVPDTSDTYALSRINKKVEERLAERKKGGRAIMSEAEMDALIDEILNEETGSNGKNR